MIRTSLALAVAMPCLVAVPALAQDQRAVLRTACKSDYDRLCSGVTPGGGRIVKCLRDNGDKLTQACKTALDQTKTNGN